MASCYFSRVVLVLLLLLGLADRTSAMTYELDASMTNSAINSVLQGLQPGDVANFANGTYNNVDLKLQNASQVGLKGNGGAYITIQGSGDTIIVAKTTAPEYQECILLPSGAQYIIIKNFICTHITGNTQAGIWIADNVNNINIIGNTIHDVTGTGIQLNKNNVYDILIEDNYIYNTGQYLADSQNGGYGIWAGGLEQQTRTTGVINIVIRHNLIHDTEGQEGSCVRLFYGVYGSSVVDNVLFNCPRGQGGQTETYAVIVIGSSDQADNAACINTVARNLLFNVAGTGNQRNIGIYASAGTQVINNLVINSDTGIAIRREAASRYANTAVIHNTVYEIRDVTNSYSALTISDPTTNDASSFIVRNNVLSVGSHGATAFAYRFGSSQSASMVVSNNYFYGQSYQELAEPSQMAPLTNNSVFVHPSATISNGVDFMCQGVLVGGGVDAGVTDDFDTNPRSSRFDVGCYQSGTGGDHWAINAQFKGSSGSPVICVDCSSGSSSDADSLYMRQWHAAYFGRRKDLH